MDRSIEFGSMEKSSFCRRPEGSSWVVVVESVGGHSDRWLGCGFGSWNDQI